MTTRTHPLRPHTDVSDRLTDAQYRALASQRARLTKIGIMDDTIYAATLGTYPCSTRPPDPAAPWPALGQPCTSRRHLSRRQARSLITAWTLAGAPIGGPYSNSRGHVQAMAEAGIPTLPTGGQHDLIAHLVSEIAWRSPDGYRGWLAARLRLDPAQAPKTFSEAESIIEGLKALQRHGHGRRSPA